MARTRSELPSTCHAWRPEALPMETWSSWPALVGIESTLAGWQSDLLSLTREAATYCGIMKPELRPPFAVRKAGRPAERLGLTTGSIRPAEIIGDAEAAIAKASRAE